MDTDNKKIGEKKALGRGLAALLGEQNPDATQQTVSHFQTPSSQDGELKELGLTAIEANPDQPRKSFNQERIQELADSIKEQGLMQPILVKMTNQNQYQIIAGERRFRAAKLAGLERIKAIVRYSSNDEKDELGSLIENIQREDLNAIELAEAYKKLMQNHGFTQEVLAKKLGISRVSLANQLRLLKLPEGVKELVVSRRISEGHARALLVLDNEEDIRKLAEITVDEKLAVREVERRAKLRIFDEVEEVEQKITTKKIGQASSDAMVENPHKNAGIAKIEDELRQLFGCKAKIRGNENGGLIEIYYSGGDSLDRILHQMRSIES